MTYIQEGTRNYKLASLALFLGGFVTFSILYTTQPLMPIFTREFHVSAPAASLTLSLSTGVLAVVMLFAAGLSDAFGKKKIMLLSMLCTSLLGIATSWSPNFFTLISLRALLGVFIAGVPSIAMAYVSEEFHPGGIGKVMGLYISGTSIGGMAGRIITGALTDMFSWRMALMCVGILTLILTVIFSLTLPAPRGHNEKKASGWRSAWNAYQSHLKSKKLLALVLLAFLLMGSFVTLYNYIGFMLEAPPYELSQTLIGFIFIVYITGTFSSVYMGKKADLHGNAPILKISLALMMLGAVLTLIPLLGVKILGMALFTFGFFGCHSIASAWVGQAAGHHKAQASSLYLLLYYLGSSLVGSFGGFFWIHFQWTGVVALIFVLLALGFPLVRYAEKGGH
ncbi:MFS transporter [Falsibacillus albus]|uniref:MFS transporter n=1 Tax=Falsibacillus albus TaxID=2478915 RepID=A0A3L7JSG9_9BACI|nr:MFS transporter [Falsibacillus albus]RLQ93827.1 MFS transporter [Falsibacillus albus]